MYNCDPGCCICVREEPAVGGAHTCDMRHARPGVLEGPPTIFRRQRFGTRHVVWDADAIKKCGLLAGFGVRVDAPRLQCRVVPQPNGSPFVVRQAPRDCACDGRAVSRNVTIMSHLFLWIMSFMSRHSGRYIVRVRELLSARMCDVLLLCALLACLLVNVSVPVNQL